MLAVLGWLIPAAVLLMGAGAGIRTFIGAARA